MRDSCNIVIFNLFCRKIKYAIYLLDFETLKKCQQNFTDYFRDFETYKKCQQNFTDYFRDFGGSTKHIKNVNKISRIVSVILVMVDQQNIK